MEHFIVFTRHAHRDTSQRDDDNGIDDKGHRQVKELLEKLEKGKLPKAKEFWSSPKLRCVQTLEPLAQKCNAKLKIVNDLDEQTSRESGKDFRKRISNFIEKLKEQKETIYLCSHGDWLPEAVQELTGQWADLGKGDAVVCVKDGKNWVLK